MVHHVDLLRLRSLCLTLAAMEAALFFNVHTRLFPIIGRFFSSLEQTGTIFIMHNFDISDSHARNFIQRIHNYMHTTALTAAKSANLISRRLLAFTILHHIINSFRRNIIGSPSHDAIIFFTASNFLRHPP